MKKTMKPMRLALSLLVVSMLCGCESAEVEKMELALTKNGWSKQQASCFAKKWADDAKGEMYNYVVRLMEEGVEDSDAFNRTRRKFGETYFESDIKGARKACGKN